MTNTKAKIIKVAKVVFFLGIVPGILGSYYFYGQLQSLTSRVNALENQKSTTSPSTPAASGEKTTIDLSSYASLKDLEILKTELSANNTKETVITQKVITEQAKSKSTDVIPLDGTSTATSTDWVTLEGTAVYVDVENDYGKDAYITWSASLKVAHGNGQAFARLYDATHNIAVDGSELTTVNNADFQTKESSALPLWRGNNLYKVQVKSLNSFEITYSSGKIKVVY